MRGRFDRLVLFWPPKMCQSAVASGLKRKMERFFETSSLKTSSSCKSRCLVNRVRQAGMREELIDCIRKPDSYHPQPRNQLKHVKCAAFIYPHCCHSGDEPPAAVRLIEVNIDGAALWAPRWLQAGEKWEKAFFTCMEVNALLLTPPQDKQPRIAQLKHRAGAGAAAQMLFLRVICQPGFKVLTVPIRYGPRSQAKASLRPAGAHHGPPPAESM